MNIGIRGNGGVIMEYTCVIATSGRLDGDDGSEAREDLLGAQDRVAIVCCVLTRFTLLSTASFGVRDAVNSGEV